MLRLLLLLSCIIVLHGRICPPSCAPPKTQRGCQAYAKRAACSQEVRDISTSEAHCGCLWQTYIQTIEPEAKIIFTSDGNQCYKWAAKVCSYLEETEQAILRQRNSSPTKSKIKQVQPGNPFNDMLRRIEQIESALLGKTNTEVAKHRRRNGVEMISRQLEKVLEKEKKDFLRQQQRATSKPGTNDADFVGKPEESKGAVWIEVVPEKSTKGDKGSVVSGKNLKKIKIVDAGLPLKVKNSSTVKNIYQVSNTTLLVDNAMCLKCDVMPVVQIRRHWIDIDMPDDKFKLGVFMVILLLNILFVVVLIFCRGSGSSDRLTDTKPTGDLDASVYWPDSPSARSGSGKEKHNSQFRNFFDKFSWSKTKEKRRKSNPFLQMEHTDKHDFIAEGNEFSKVRTSSPYIDAGMYRSPQRISRGLYENIAEEPDFLDHTYEDPLPPPTVNSESREYYRRKYSLRSDSGTEDGSSPTKYFPKDLDANSKSVSFTLPPGTYITLQDRMVARTPRRRRGRMKGLAMPFRMGYNR